MGYQAPPNLPDYSKLTFLLNSSGVQKWNPAVYDILKQLIGAVQQSQDVISTNIDSIPSGVGVSVDPAGALSGDGTSGSPLAVKVDGSTISIIGDVLQAVATQAVFLNTGSLINILPPNSTNVPFAARTQIGTVVAVPGKTIWPLAICMTGGQVLTGGAVGGWAPAVAWDVIWNGISSSIITGSRQIFLSGGSSQFTELIPFTTTEISTTTLNAFRNVALIVRTNNGANTLGSTDGSTTMTNSASYTLLYVLL